MITFTKLELSNFGVVSQATLPLEGQGLVLIRGDNQDTAAADSNGSGKTTMFKAMSWCLFGEVVGDGRVTSEIIRHGSKKATVSVDFSDGGHEYRVERSRTPSGGKLTLFTDGVSTTGRTSKDTEERIGELLGLDWHSFRNTVLYGQGDIKRFADKHTTDAERKGILKQVLRLDVYDKARDEAKARLKALEAQIWEENSKWTMVGVRLDEARLNATSEELVRDGFESDQQIIAARLREEADQLLSQARTHQSKANDAETHREALKQMDMGLSTRSSDALDLIRATEERATAERDRGDKSLELASSKGRLKTAEEREHRAMDAARNAQRKVNEIKEADDCPTCGQKWPTDTRAKQLETAEGEMGKGLDRTIAARGCVTDEMEAVKRLQQDVDEATAVVNATIKVQAAARKRNDETVLMKRERADIADELADFGDVEQVVARLKERAEDLQERARQELVKENPHTERCATAMERRDQLQAQSKKMDADIEKMAEGIDPLKWWAQAFSDKGLPSLAMDNVMPLLTESANGYLDILTDGDITVDISTEKALKGGGMRDNISITQSIEGLPDVTPSGGQRSKISLAIDLGLMDVVASREGAEINLMMLDEVLDGLDGEGKARVVTLLQHLRTVRPSLFVVSHDDSIQEHFEKVITVTKKGGQSTLENK